MIILLGERDGQNNIVQMASEQSSATTLNRLAESFYKCGIDGSESQLVYKKE